MSADRRDGEKASRAQPPSGGSTLEPHPPVPLGPPADEPYPGARRPNSLGGWWSRALLRIRYLISHHILHLDDTPHRIALGVFLGFLIGATPTLGIQMILYFSAVELFRANRVSGLGPVWITNPLTAVPIYYFNWRLGVFMMTGRLETSPESRLAIERLVEGTPGQNQGFIERLFDRSFWVAAFDLLMSIGAELWVGSLFVGVVSGLLGYWLTFRAVKKYRSRRHPPSTAS